MINLQTALNLYEDYFNETSNKKSIHIRYQIIDFFRDKDKVYYSHWKYWLLNILVE